MSNLDFIELLAVFMFGFSFYHIVMVWRKTPVRDQSATPILPILHLARVSEERDSRPWALAALVIGFALFSATTILAEAY